jgi:hypothetical protein
LRCRAEEKAPVHTCVTLSKLMGESITF